MAVLTLRQVIEALTGQPAAGMSAGPIITEVVIDSRLASPGALFVALPGERTDGHAYVAAAFNKGAVAALVQGYPAEWGGSEAWPVIDLRPEAATSPALPAEAQPPICLRVGDPLQALQTLAGWWRQRQPVRVIGVTGSVGKTTSKEVIAAVLSTRYRTFKTEGNYNNEIGLPLMLLRLNETHECAVLELGFYQPGEIKFLCDLARPHVGVVTNVYGVHLERAGSLEAIAQGKAELVAALPPGPTGVAVLNADDPRVLAMRALTQARVVTYGLDPAADLWADEIESLGLGGIRFRLHAGEETLQLHVPLLGRHSVHTVLRAAAVGLAEGLTWQDIIAGLQLTEATQLRLVAVAGPGGSLILDDTYNASPESVVAALNLLADLDGRRIAVLGDMLELGEQEEVGHRLVGRRAREVAALLVAVGPRARLMADEARTAGLSAQAVVELDTVDEAIEFLRREIGAGDVVLLKGSHSLRLDRIVPALEVRP